MKNNVLALVAAIVAGVVGHFAFLWIAKYGFLALVLPGGLMGIAASMFKSRSIPVHISCGLMGLFEGLFAEWSRAPFNKDPSFSFFVSHANHLNMIAQLMIVGGAVLAFWIPFNHRNDDLAPEKANQIA